MVRTRGSMSPSPEVSGSKKKVEKAEEVSKNMVGSGSKVVESDKEKKNKNLSISKRSGVSEATSDDRHSKKLKSVVEDEDDFDSECDEAPIVLPKKLKVWDLYLKPEDRFCGKIIYWFDVGVIAEIKGRLNAKQLTMFQESCFGHFLDLEECNMQSQVIHTALCREVHQANVKEIWFDFGNSRTRFGLGEFAIISGLLCKGDSSMEKYIGRGDTFVDKYFSDMTVNYAAIKQRFLNSIFKDDVFAFRMAVLYFVTNFLLSKPGRKKVSSGLLHLIGSGEFNSFPWGKVAYDTTLYSLRTVLKEKNKKKVVDETKGTVASKAKGKNIKGKEKDYNSKTYKLCGFPFAFQVWLYEVIPLFKKQGLCTYDASPDYRMCRWSSVGNPFSGEVEKKIYMSTKFSVTRMFPSAEENQKLDIAGFEFSYGSESDDDFEDVRQPRVDVDKTGSSGVEKKATISLAVLDELKDSVLGLVVRQVGLECVLKEFRKEVDEKFALLEENLKGYIDRKVGEDLTFYFDTKFSELKDLIKDSIENVVPQSNEDEDEDDGGGGGNDSPRNLDDISDDVEPTVKGDGEDAGEDAADVKDGEDCVGGDGDVYKEIKNISEMSVKEVDSQDFAGLCSLEKDMPNFDILGSLLGQNETVAMVEDEVLGSDGGNVGGVEGVAEKVSAGTDDGFSESVMAVINQKVDDVCHAYEVKKIMDKIKVCESPKSKRAHKPSVVLQSPYRNDFGSSGSNEKMKKKNVKGQYAFNSGLFDPPHELQQKAFDEWFCVGFKDENKKKKFVQGKNLFSPALDFCIDSVQDKWWFYDLLTPGRCLSDSHMDVIFYYLRKKLKYDPNVAVSATTTDYHFCFKVVELYDKFVKSGNKIDAVPKSNIVTEYMSGYYMYANKDWLRVDYVLIYMHIKDEKHWILIIFDIRARCLNVYNSLGSRHELDRKTAGYVKPFAVVLPICLSFIDYYSRRMDIDTSQGFFKGKKEEDMLDVFVVTKLPQQVDNDCGLFVAKYADFFIHGCIEKLPNPLDVGFFRRKLAVELYVHAKKKLLNDYDSESEFPGRIPKA
ncbi:hypothetical protein CsatB_008370 [Cannabis sativa]